MFKAEFYPKWNLLQQLCKTWLIPYVCTNSEGDASIYVCVAWHDSLHKSKQINKIPICKSSKLLQNFLSRNIYYKYKTSSFVMFWTCFQLIHSTTYSLHPVQCMYVYTWLSIEKLKLKTDIERWVPQNWCHPLNYFFWVLHNKYIH